MITPLLKLALDPVVRRHRLLRTLSWSAGLLASLAVILFVWKATGHRLPIPVTVVLAYLVGWRLAVVLANRWEPNYTDIARRVEDRHPDLHALLLTAVEQRPDPATGKLHFLQQRVLADAVAQARKHQWVDAVPRSRIALGWTGLALLVVSLVFVAKPGPKRVAKAQPVAKAAPEAVVDGVEVTPGDTELERGTGLVVLAKFGRNVPTEAAMVIQRPNQPEQRLPLVKNLDDPVFGGGLPEVDSDLTYRVEYAGESTREFKVKVFEHPRLDRADASMRFPAYTGQPDKTVPDTRRISAVEGTKLDLAFQLNKPVQSAELVTKDGTSIPLEIDPAKPTAKLSDYTIASSQLYTLRLHDADGRENKVPAQIHIDALANKRPELKLLSPRGDVRVSPLQELSFAVQAWDDFGLARYGLTYTVAGQEPKDVEFGTASKPDEKLEAAHMLKLEAMKMKPDELISYFVWAEDTGADGKPRRTATDMFFAEVRPFEEIYRPGDGSEGQQGQSGGAGEAMKLAELQKQIITATWNLKRADDANTAAEKPNAKYREDEPVIRDSQAEALRQAKELAAKAEEAKAQELMEAVTKAMEEAHQHLEAAATTSEPLPKALASEQEAYNALLKLAAHEYRIVRNQRSRGKQSGGQRQQAQLDELEMKMEDKRYENQREAESPESEQQREQLAILNRLKELAQRQQDINERLKELQTALQAAKTEEGKEEVRRELKRLREEEQQLLSDIDETRQRMEQSSSQSQMANERKQLEQTRAEAQQASEAMEKNSPSQALANGTRAQRQLQDIRDEFRKKTSGQFNEEMRQMRSDARELAESQQELADQLASKPEKKERPTLDGSSEREQLAEKFQRQQEGLEKLTEDMKRVSEQAEAAEPLLARELYDTLRKTAQSDTAKTLEMTQALSQRGYKEQAQQFESKAREEIEELKKGVERAAESVLGDEAEALRQARTELDQLTSELNRELSQARPDLTDNSENSGPSSAAQKNPDDTEPKPGEPGAAGQQQANRKGQPDAKQGESDSPKQPGGKSPSEQEANRVAQTGENQPRPGQQPGEPGSQPGQGEPSQEPGKPGESNAQAGQRQAQQQPNGQQPGSQQPGSKQPGEQSGQGQRGNSRSMAQNASPGLQGESPDGTNGEGATPGEREAGGNAEPTRGEQRRRLAELSGSRQDRERGGNDGRGDWRGGPANGEQAGPLTGDNFVDWSDRLRKVEEMLDSPELRREVASVREVARAVRSEFKRHSLEPNWEMVKSRISTPLAELRNRVTEELARRDSKENLVPIDRDPVPAQFAERVRRYYEDLGRGR